MSSNELVQQYEQLRIQLAAMEQEVEQIDEELAQIEAELPQEIADQLMVEI